MNDATRTTDGQRTPEVRQSYGAAASRYAREQKLGAAVEAILRESMGTHPVSPSRRTLARTLHQIAAAARELGLLDEEAPR